MAEKCHFPEPGASVNEYTYYRREKIELLVQNFTDFASAFTEI